MTIKQQGGIFGRNPTFSDVNAKSLTLTDSVPQLQFIDADDTDQVAQINFGFGHIDIKADINNDRGASRITFNIDGSEVGRWNDSGNLVIANSGNGIDFSATAGTGTSELFDDYEEGVFTPTVEGATTAGSGTYANQLGYYTKVGRLVTFQIWLQVSTHTGTGTTKIMGMPYATSGTDAATGGAHVAYCANLTLSSSHVVQCAMGSNGNSYLVLQQYPLTGTATSLGVPVDGNMQVRLVGSYISA